MTLESARRLTEILMAWAFVQQGLEHLAGARDGRWRFGAQVALASGIAGNVSPAVLEGLLLLVSLDVLRRFDGPYNGGSDRMRLLVLSCVWASRLAPWPVGQRAALGYLAVQVALSYAMAGGVKLANPDWRSGRALQDVFAFSVYPVSEGLRAWVAAPRALRALSWTMMAFEVAFPLALLSAAALPLSLGAALAFHLVNACVFGLNRFVWIWVAGYPCLLWFQHAVVAPAL